MNGIGFVTARLGQYMDHFLKPLVCGTKAYLRDTSYIIQILEMITLPSQSYLVTADVGLLYTIIGHEDAMSSVQWALEASALSVEHRSYLLECLGFCLQKNYYWYNHCFYLQSKGVAMGARFPC